MDDNDVIVVCGETSSFPDDIKVTCECGKVIYVRPYQPPEAKKICLPCFLARADENAKIFVRPETVREVMKFMKERNH